MSRTRMLSLDEVIITADLARRPSRPPDHESENKALVGLMEIMAGRLQADDVLQKLVEKVIVLCRVQSAGISLLERDEEGREVFRWRAAAGRWAAYRGEAMPRISPCGTVIDRNAVQLMRYPERHYAYDRNIDLPIAEALLVPFHFHGDPVGTVWMLMHDEGRTFDNEDRRLLSSMARVAASAYQLLHWRETGGPAVAAPMRKGFGYSVTVRSVEHALDAEVDLAFAETGVSWTIVAPTAAVIERSRRLFEELGSMGVS